MIAGFSGAETANIVNEAALVGARVGKPAVDLDCFHEARDRILIGPARPAAGLSDEERRIAAAMTTIFAGCQSWYLDATGVPASWPWSYDAFVEAMKTPKLENYRIAA